MKNPSLILIMLAFLCCVQGWAAAATALRVWTSKKGTTVVARAESLVDGQVTLVKRGGKKVTLAMSELTVSDQLLLKNHFPLEAPERNDDEGEDDPDIELGGDDDPAVERFDDLPKDFEGGLGMFHGPIKASEGSSYYIYLPTTMVKGQEAPLLFWTGHHQGHRTTLNFLEEGAEITGTVLAVSVESRSDGEDTHAQNLEHTKDCLRHISLKLPVETKWTIFAGNDRGGASAFYNTDRFRCAGAFAINAYIPKKTVANGRGYYFVACGAQHRNRYRSARAVNTVGDYGVFYPYPGNVRFPKSYVGTHGMIWLYTRHLYSMSRLRSEEARNFEKRFAPWLKEHAELSPGEAYYFVKHLLVTCDVGGEFRDFLLKLQEQLEKDPDAVNYFDGRKALAKFAEKVYAGFGARDMSLGKNHTSTKIENEVEKLKEKYGSDTDLSIIFSRLALPTMD